MGPWIFSLSKIRLTSEVRSWKIFECYKFWVFEAKLGTSNLSLLFKFLHLHLFWIVQFVFRIIHSFLKTYKLSQHWESEKYFFEKKEEWARVASSSQNNSEDKNVELRCNLQFSKFLVFGAELGTSTVHSDVSKNMFILIYPTILMNYSIFPKILKYFEKWTVWHVQTF